MTEQDALVAEILGDVVPVGDVPPNFAQAVTEHIAARPSPKTQVDTDRLILDKLDEILTLLRGTTE